MTYWRQTGYKTYALTYNDLGHELFIRYDNGKGVWYATCVYFGILEVRLYPITEDLEEVMSAAVSVAIRRPDNLGDDVKRLCNIQQQITEERTKHKSIQALEEQLKSAKDDKKILEHTIAELEKQRDDAIEILRRWKKEVT